MLLSPLLFLTTDLDTGGAEMMLFHLLSCLDKSRFSPHLVSLKPNGTLLEKFKELDIPLYDLGIQSPLQFPQGLLRLNRLVRQIQPALIQTWMYHADFLASLGKQLFFRKIPVVWSLHYSGSEAAVKPATHFIRQRLAGLSSSVPAGIVACSESTRRLHQQLGYDPDRLLVIPNGVDLQKYQRDAAAHARLRQELGLAENTFIIGHVGRFHPDKDHTTLLTACKIFFEKTASDVHFVLVGLDVDENNAYLQGLLESYNLQSKVHLLGLRKDIPLIMAGFDLFTLSSRTEASPLVILEAMASSLPCVATDVGDVGDMLGDTGLLVPPLDPPALAAAWLVLLQMDPEQRGVLGRKAFERAACLYSLEQTVKAYEALFRSILQN